MSTKTELLALLAQKEGRYASGQELADTLGVSRNAIWKAVKALQEQGYAIESLPSTGYRLRQKADILTRDAICEALHVPLKLHLLDKVDSTNNYAKTLPDLSLPQLVVSEEQTAGRGRLGRSFYSPAGKGIYMSFAFCPQLELSQAMLVTTMTAVAVCRALESLTGLRPKIKWVNDIYLNEKKLCGILTEAETNFETGEIQKIIVGIGINCFEDASMPPEIREVATFLDKPQESFDRNALIAAIANEFFDMLAHFDRAKIVRDYRARSFILGQQILIFNPAIARAIGRPDNRLSEGIRARAIDIDENGGLVVEYLEGTKSRQMETLSTGEISVRKVYD